MKKRPTRESLYTFTMFIFSTLVYVLYILLATQNHFSYLEPMLNGTAARPYVYRVLVPFIVRIISDSLEVSPYFVAAIVMYISLLGFSWTILQMAKIYLPSQYSLPLVQFAPIGLIPFLIEQRHIYDFTTLFLFTLALYFLTKNNFNEYILAFTFSTFSKETSFFLVVFFALQFGKRPNKRFCVLLLIQIVIYVLIRLMLIVIFKDNPGSLMEFHLYDHLIAYREHPINAFILFVAIVLILVTGMIRTSDKTNFVRNSLLAIGGPTLFLYFPFGVPFEIRIFLESYTSLFLMITLAIVSLLNSENKIKTGEQVS